MLLKSLQITPMAALSRPTCGITSSGTVIITLPGSPKGATENLEAVLPVLPHALALARGESSRQLHAREPSTSVSATSEVILSGHHHHSHHHHGDGHHVPKPRTLQSNDVNLGRTCGMWPWQSLTELHII